MIQGLQTLSASHLPSSIPGSHIPQSPGIPLIQMENCPDLILPTHILAVYKSSHGVPHSETYKLFPVHSDLLGLYCPPIQPAREPVYLNKTVDLPVIIFSLPCPSAFIILLDFMYKQRKESLLRGVFSLPADLSLSGPDSAVIQGLSDYLYDASKDEPFHFIEHIRHVRDLWQNICALHIRDEDSWEALDIAWASVGGLALAGLGETVRQMIDFY